MKLELSNKEVAAILGFAIEGLLLKPEVIIQWADKIIENKTDVEDFLIDISLSSSKGVKETLHILNQNNLISLNENSYNILCGLTGYMFSIHKINLKQATYFIYKLSLDLYNEKDYDLFDMGLDDAFYLAENGIYGNIKNVEKRFLELTSPYKTIGETFYIDYLTNPQQPS